MSKCIFALYVLCSCFSLHAQSKIDSLKAELEKEIPDTSRVKTLQSLARYVGRVSLDTSIIVAHEAEALSQKIKWKKGISESYYQLARLYSTISVLDTAIIFYDKGIEIAKEIGDQKRMADNYYYKANAISNQDDYKKSIPHYQEALKIYHEIGAEEVIMRCNINYAWVLSESGDLTPAAELLYNSIRIAEKLGAERSIFNARHELGYIELTLGNTDDALKTFTDNLKLAEKLDIPYKKSVAYGDLGMIYSKLKKYELALEYDKLDLQTQLESGNKKDLPLIYNNIGINYIELKDYRKAIEYFKQSQNIEVQHRDNYNKVLSEVNLGIANAGLGNYELASSYFKTSLDNSLKMNNPELIEISRKSMIEAAKESRDYKTAFEQSTLLDQYQDSLYSLEKQSQFKEIETKFETEKKEKEIIVLEKNAEISQIKQTRLWVTMLSSLLLGGFGIFYFWNKRKTDKKLLLHENEIEKQKRLNVELENERLNLDLEYKKQELAAKVLTLCKKNEFLASLEQEVKKLSEDQSNMSSHSSSRLSRLINQDIDSESEWEEFLQSFTDIHQGFLKNIQSNHPNLSKNELRLCCLLKMNLSSKDISNMLNISAAGIKKARYRLRKKLEMNTEDSLEGYLIAY